MAEEYAMTWGDPATSNDRMWATLAWASSYMFAFVAPIVIMVVFQEKSKYIKYHAIQALVFQAAFLAVNVVVLPVVSFVTCGVGAVLYLPALCLPLYGAYLSWTGQWNGMPGLSNFGK